ncbi:MAG TPA: fatty acid desaturase, partial [Stellaceae bacterium]|nr:fatty acid desaturase [Stellaceae bacterium]
MIFNRDTVADNTDPRTLLQMLDIYKRPSRIRGTFELAVTILPLAFLWIAAWLAYTEGYWWICLLIAIPAAGLLLRLFVIQHDCGHGIFYPHKQLNDWVGRLISVLTMTPYDFWRRTHAIHHATCGNLDRRGIGD